MLRRTFVQSAGGAATALAEPARPAPCLIGVDSYSIRSFHWKALQLLDYTAKLKLNTIQISSLGEYESLDPAYVQKVKDHADRLGIAIDAGIGCICPTSASFNKKEGAPGEYILRGLRTAKAVGASAMRCFLGSAAERRGKLPIEAHMEVTIKVIRSVRQQALDTGVKLAIENHNGDMEAGEVKTLVEEAGVDLVGVCYDSGNPMHLMEDPWFALETLAPYVATSHFRDSAVWEHARGAAFQWVALGDGSIGADALLKRFRQLCPRAPMQLEIITGRPPQLLPYFEADHWKAFPKKRASEFARFVELAKRGHPFMGAMMVAGSGQQPPEFEAALKEQQRVDLERSVEFAKRVLWS